MTDKRRDHEPYHLRQLEAQQLDALVRIEELLGRLVDHFMAEAAVSGPPIEELITNVEPTKTPFMERIGAKPARKPANKRSL